MTKKWLSASTVLVTVLTLLGVAVASPSQAAPVANCKPTAAHPYPVVLVHGTFGNSSNWSQFQPTLKQRGYCVSAFDYQSSEDIALSAALLSNYVNQVLQRTGASKVDLIGHSQGGMMPRYYIKFLGGAAKVHQEIAFAPSNYGTTESGFATLAGLGGGLLSPVVYALCSACQEQIFGSAFLLGLNAGSDTAPGVSFTVIETTHDEVVTPFTNAFLHGAGSKNITVQNTCPLDISGHIALALNDQNAWQFAYNALDPAHPQPIRCVAALNPI